MALERNREASRRLILERLARRGKKWTMAGGILGELTDEGPWSEDLVDMIREGLVECQDQQPGPRSLVREAAAHEGR